MNMKSATEINSSLLECMQAWFAAWLTSDELQWAHLRIAELETRVAELRRHEAHNVLLRQENAGLRFQVQEMEQQLALADEALKAG